MSAPFRRLRDDPRTSSVLRAGLVYAAVRTKQAPFDVSRGLSRFQAAIAVSAVVLPTEAPANAVAPAKVAAVAGKGFSFAVLKGALLGLAVGGAALGGAMGVASRMDAEAPVPGLVAEHAHFTELVEAGRAAVRAGPMAPEVPRGAEKSEPEARDRSVDALAGTGPAATGWSSAATSEPSARGGAALNPGPSAAATNAAVTSAAAGGSAPRLAAKGPKRGEAGRSSLELEMKNVAVARSKARAAPAEALALAEEGNRSFASGLFHQEREAIAMDALARLGRSAEAKTRARAFLAQYASSTFAERAREIVETDL